MSTPQPIPLTPVLITPSNPEYKALVDWPFSEQSFYEGQVKRLLQNDIPQRLVYGFGSVWVYRDPDAHTVGFGTLVVCHDYKRLAGGKLHSYIPLLAVHPDCKKRGHGQSIVQHLIAQAVLLSLYWEDLSDLLFLDVYTANEPAISLYAKCGFQTVHGPIPDPRREQRAVHHHGSESEHCIVTFLHPFSDTCGEDR